VPLLSNALSGQVPGLLADEGPSTSFRRQLLDHGWQFNLSLSIDVAEQGLRIITASGTYLPSTPAPPIYSKTNPRYYSDPDAAYFRRNLPLSNVEISADTMLAP